MKKQLNNSTFNLTEEELDNFYNQNCRACGSQRCPGCYDEEWCDGCTLLKEYLMHKSAVENNETKVLEQTKNKQSKAYPQPTKESFEKVREILNKPRPYRSSDSKKQHFIPDL